MKFIKFEICDGLPILNSHTLPDIWLKSARKISEHIIGEVVFNLQEKIGDEIFPEE